MKITKFIDAHIKLAEELEVEIAYISVSRIDRDALTDEILTAAGMEPGSIEFEGVKSYMGIRIATHDVSPIKVTYSR